MAFTKATKAQAKARVAITGPAGAGKSWTALKLATSMCKRVAAIDTEHGSLSKYADEFEFDTMELIDFHPNSYIQGIKDAEAGGYDGLIIDSASHEWFGKNGCLQLSEQAAKRHNGNSYVGWGDVTPLHVAFIEAILGSKLHIVATFRSKMDYLQGEDSRGKKTITKVGMAPITRDGVEYEFDIVGDMDVEHNMIITKSRCKALADRVINKPGEELADSILAWLTDGVDVPVVPSAPPTPTDQPSSTLSKVITDGQRKRLFALAHEHNWTDDELKALLKQKSYDSSKAILAADYESICNELLAKGLGTEGAQ